VVLILCFNAPYGFICEVQLEWSNIGRHIGSKKGLGPLIHCLDCVGNGYHPDNDENGSGRTDNNLWSY
jgi:hypothetical protein